MGNLPTKTEYNALDATEPDVVKKALLYRQNKKVYAILRLGQQTNQGKALILKYKSDDFPHTALPVGTIYRSYLQSM